MTKVRKVEHYIKTDSISECVWLLSRSRRPLQVCSSRSKSILKQVGLCLFVCFSKKQELFIQFDEISIFYFHLFSPSLLAQFDGDTQLPLSWSTKGGEKTWKRLVETWDLLHNTEAINQDVYLQGMSGQIWKYDLYWVKSWILQSKQTHTPANS